MKKNIFAMRDTKCRFVAYLLQKKQRLDFAYLSEHCWAGCCMQELKTEGPTPRLFSAWLSTNFRTQQKHQVDLGSGEFFTHFLAFPVSRLSAEDWPRRLEPLLAIPPNRRGSRSYPLDRIDHLSKMT
jgi:hypothetical protein